MSKETVENLINRSDLSDAEKVGILMDRYALNPDAKREPLVQKWTEEHPKNATKTVNNKDGTFTIYQGSVMNGKFQRHGTASTYLETDKETLVKTTQYRGGKKHGTDRPVARQSPGRTGSLRDDTLDYRGKCNPGRAAGTCTA